MESAEPVRSDQCVRRAIARGWTRPGETLLHIGLPKTGTTAVQHSLADARSVLARRRVLYPGTERSQWTATTAMLGLPHLYWPDDSPPRPDDREWCEIVDELRHADAGHRRVISAESMCAANERQVDRVVDDLCHVRVVVAVRRLDRHLVSNWQQRLRVGLDVDLDRWLVRILDAEARGDVVGSERVFGLMSAEVVGRWVDRVGSDRVAVVVVDEQQRTQLDALESMLDLEPGDLRLSADPEARNRSLTVEEASILLDINRMIDRSETSFDDHRRVIVPMVETLQRRSRGDGRRLEFPSWAGDRVREIAMRNADAIAATGVAVVGELDSMVPHDPRSGGDGAHVTQ